VFGAGIDPVLGAFAEQIRGEDCGGQRWAHQEIGGSGTLVVAVAGVEFDPVFADGEAVAQGLRAVPLSVGVARVGEALVAGQYQCPEPPAHRCSGAGHELIEGVARVATPKRMNNSTRHPSPSRIAAIEARVSESGTREMDRVRIRFAPAVGQADFQPGGQTTEPATDDIVLATLEA